MGHVPEEHGALRGERLLRARTVKALVADGAINRVVEATLRALVDELRGDAHDRSDGVAEGARHQQGGPREAGKKKRVSSGAPS